MPDPSVTDPDAPASPVRLPQAKGSAVFSVRSAESPNGGADIPGCSADGARIAAKARASLVAEPRLFDMGHEQGPERDERYTPREVFDALALRFDLDVCAPPGGVPWVPADRYYTSADDGLAQPWEGRVWMNPPYSNATPWVDRFITHRHGIALVGHAKSAWHPRLWAAADGAAIPFTYWDFVGGSIFMPVWFAAFGEECVEALSRVGVVRVRSAA